MKKIFTLLFSVSVVFFSFSQENYPKPKKTTTRLFYIQHSNNFNTYVYDARLSNNKTLDSQKPIDQYRIVYTEDGKKKPLTLIQKKYAYGMRANKIAVNFYRMHISGAKNFLLYLIIDSKDRARVYTVVNDKKLFLDHIFVKLKEKTFGLNSKAEYILLFGRDFNTGEKRTTKVFIN